MNIIVTTTINKPTKAILKFASMKDWHLIVVVDKKTKLESYKKLKNISVLSCIDQIKISKKLSDLIGWNSIQRRNFGFIEAYKLGAKVIATVDDDNIPYKNWGKNLKLGKKIKVRNYNEKNFVFNPLSPFKHYNKIWHRGYPLELIQNNIAKPKYSSAFKKFDIRADLWDGNPDIDSINRLTLKKINFKYNNKYFFSSNKFSPFNSQNTFLSREVLPHYFMFPHIGRLDDIWASYYVQSLGFKICYGPSTVFQERNYHDFSNDFKEEIIGYINNLKLCKELAKSSNNIKKFLPKRSYEAFKVYQKFFRK